MSLFKLWQKLDSISPKERLQYYKKIAKCVSDKSSNVSGSEKSKLSLQLIEQDLDNGSVEMKITVLHLIGLLLSKDNSGLLSCDQKILLTKRIAKLLHDGNISISRKILWCLSQGGFTELEEKVVTEIISGLDVIPQTPKTLLYLYEALSFLQRLLKECKPDMEEAVPHIFKFIFQSSCHTASKIREVSSPLVELCLPSFTQYRSKISPVLVKLLKSSLQKDMLHLFDHKQEKYVFDIWCHIVDLLGTDLHVGGSSVVNLLMEIVEKGFKMNNEETLKITFKAWLVLIRNFALNIDVLSNPKRLQLLLRPLKLKLKKAECVRETIFQTFWFLAVSLKDKLSNNFEQVCVPLLEFLLPSVKANDSLLSTPNQKSPENEQPVSLKLALEMLLRLLEQPSGLIAYNASFLTISPLEVPIPNSVILRHFKKIVKASKIIISGFNSNNEYDAHLDILFCSLIYVISQIVEDSGRESVDAVTSLLNLLANVVNNQLCSYDFCMKHLEHFSKLPQRMLISHYYHLGSNGVMHDNLSISLMSLLLKPFILSHCAEDSRHINIFRCLCNANITGSLSPLTYAQTFLHIIGNEEVKNHSQPDKLLDMWSSIAMPLLSAVQKTQEVNQGDSLENDFSCMYEVLLFPLSTFLPPKVTQIRFKVARKLWSDIYKIFIRCSSLISSVEDNSVCEAFCYKMKMAIRKDLSIQDASQDFSESSCLLSSQKKMDEQYLESLCQLLQVIVECFDFASAVENNSQSEGLFGAGWFCKQKQKPIGNLTSFVHLVEFLLRGFNDVFIAAIDEQDLKEPAKNKSQRSSKFCQCADLVKSLICGITNSSLLPAVLESLAIPLSRLFQTSAENKMVMTPFAVKLEALWKSVVNTIQLIYKGPFDTEFLCILSPLLKSTLLSHRKGIHEKSKQFWLASFSANQSTLKYPDGLKEALVKSKLLLSDVSLVSGDAHLLETTSVSLNDDDTPVLINIQEEPLTPVLNTVKPPKVETRTSNTKKTQQKRCFNLDDLPEENFVVIPPSTSASFSRRKSARKSFVPALYNDLSQNSCLETNSQSLSNSNNFAVEESPIESKTLKKVTVTPAIVCVSSAVSASKNNVNILEINEIEETPEEIALTLEKADLFETDDIVPSSLCPEKNASQQLNKPASVTCVQTENVAEAITYSPFQRLSLKSRKFEPVTLLTPKQKGLQNCNMVTSTTEAVVADTSVNLENRNVIDMELNIIRSQTHSECEKEDNIEDGVMSKNSEDVILLQEFGNVHVMENSELIDELSQASATVTKQGRKRMRKSTRIKKASDSVENSSSGSLESLEVPLQSLPNLVTETDSMELNNQSADRNVDDKANKISDVICKSSDDTEMQKDSESIKELKKLTKNTTGRLTRGRKGVKIDENKGIEPNENVIDSVTIIESMTNSECSEQNEEAYINEPVLSEDLVDSECVDVSGGDANESHVKQPNVKGQNSKAKFKGKTTKAKKGVKNTLENNDDLKLDGERETNISSMNPVDVNGCDTDEFINEPIVVVKDSEYVNELLDDDDSNNEPSADKNLVNNEQNNTVLKDKAVLHETTEISDDFAAHLVVDQQNLSVVFRPAPENNENNSECINESSDSFDDGIKHSKKHDEIVKTKVARFKKNVKCTTVDQNNLTEIENNEIAENSDGDAFSPDQCSIDEPIFESDSKNTKESLDDSNECSKTAENTNSRITRSMKGAQNVDENNSMEFSKVTDVITTSENILSFVVDQHDTDTAPGESILQKDLEESESIDKSSNSVDDTQPSFAISNNLIGKTKKRSKRTRKDANKTVKDNTVELSKKTDGIINRNKTTKNSADLCDVVEPVSKRAKKSRKIESVKKASIEFLVAEPNGDEFSESMNETCESTEQEISETSTIIVSGDISTTVNKKYVIETLDLEIPIKEMPEDNMELVVEHDLEGTINNIKSTTCTSESLPDSVSSLELFEETAGISVSPKSNTEENLWFDFSPPETNPTCEQVSKKRNRKGKPVKKEISSLKRLAHPHTPLAKNTKKRLRMKNSKTQSSKDKTCALKTSADSNKVKSTGVDEILKKPVDIQMFNNSAGIVCYDDVDSCIQRSDVSLQNVEQNPLSELLKVKNNLLEDVADSKIHSDLSNLDFVCLNADTVVDTEEIKSLSISNENFIVDEDIISPSQPLTCHILSTISLANNDSLLNTEEPQMDEIIFNDIQHQNKGIFEETEKLVDDFIGVEKVKLSATEVEGSDIEIKESSLIYMENIEPKDNLITLSSENSFSHLGELSNETSKVKNEILDEDNLNYEISDHNYSVTKTKDHSVIEQISIGENFIEPEEGCYPLEILDAIKDCLDYAENNNKSLQDGQQPAQQDNLISNTDIVGAKCDMVSLSFSTVNDAVAKDVDDAFKSSIQGAKKRKNASPVRSPILSRLRHRQHRNSHVSKHSLKLLRDQTSDKTLTCSFSMLNGDVSEKNNTDDYMNAKENAKAAGSSMKENKQGSPLLFTMSPFSRSKKMLQASQRQMSLLSNCDPKVLSPSSVLTKAEGSPMRSPQSSRQTTSVSGSPVLSSRDFISAKRLVYSDAALLPSAGILKRQNLDSQLRAAPIKKKVHFADPLFEERYIDSPKKIRPLPTRHSRKRKASAAANSNKASALTSEGNDIPLVICPTFVDCTKPVKDILCALLPSPEVVAVEAVLAQHSISTIGQLFRMTNSDFEAKFNNVLSFETLQKMANHWLNQSQRICVESYTVDMGNTCGANVDQVNKILVCMSNDCQQCVALKKAQENEERESSGPPAEPKVPDTNQVSKEALETEFGEYKENELIERSMSIKDLVDTFLLMDDDGFLDDIPPLKLIRLQNKIGLALERKEKRRVASLALKESSIAPPSEHI